MSAPSLPVTLQAARLRLATDRPYYGACLWSLVPVPAPGLGTLAVDQHHRLYYDPDVVDAWSTDQVVAVIEHEVGHLVRGHFERGRGLDPARWNVAGDAEINDDLQGRPLPQGAIFPETLGCPNGRIAEEYYSSATKRGGDQGGGAQRPAGASDEEDPKGGGGQGDRQPDRSSAKAPGGGGPGRKGTPSPQGESAVQGRGGDSMSPSRSGGSHQSGDASRRTSGTSAAGGSPEGPRPARGRCGSCATGRPEPWEAPPPGESQDAPPGVSPEEAAVIRRQVARAVAEVAKTRGDVPAGLRRWAEEALRPPRIDWRRVLASEIRRAVAWRSGAVDYSYARPSRRQAALQGVILPALVRPVPEVAVVVDTSGSMGDDEVSTALAEVQGVLRALGVPARVICADAKAYGAQRVTDARAVRVVGGGGTDMREGIAAALRLHPRPSVVIVITDGHTPWPEAAPGGCRVIAAVIGDGGPPTPNWIRRVEVQL